mmetsp:Transcript_13190/g.27248  ORF Transcript_13190/g.27248 Transcript_13190/m.27248 type:complete len:229 (+) Transcript_13190:992-1678(+)
MIEPVQELPKPEACHGLGESPVPLYKSEELSAGTERHEGVQVLLVAQHVQRPQDVRVGPIPRNKLHRRHLLHGVLHVPPSQLLYLVPVHDLHGRHVGSYLPRPALPGPLPSPLPQLQHRTRSHASVDRLLQLPSDPVRPLGGLIAPDLVNHVRHLRLLRRRRVVHRRRDSRRLPDGGVRERQRHLRGAVLGHLLKGSRGVGEEGQLLHGGEYVLEGKGVRTSAVRGLG